MDRVVDEAGGSIDGRRDRGWLDPAVGRRDPGVRTHGGWWFTRHHPDGTEKLTGLPWWEKYSKSAYLAGEAADSSRARWKPERWLGLRRRR